MDALANGRCRARDAGARRRRKSPRHQSFSVEGAPLFVKPWQMQPSDGHTVRIDTNDAALSIVTFSAMPLAFMALSKKRRAAALSCLAVSRKSTVFPSLSTAR